jgi:glycosyltransferase involved in cell wall biosynthesis
MAQRTYSIVIPAFNEETRITSGLDQVLAFVAQRGWNAEVIVVNDGSRDRTADIVRDYAHRHPHVRLLENPGNRGKGYSVRNGVLHSVGDLVLFTDADLSAPIEQATKLIAEIDAGADVAIGSRWIRPETMTERQPILRQIAGRLYNIVNRLLLGLPYRDTQCGLKAFKKKAAHDVFSRQKIERWGFDPEILFIARKCKYKIAEVPVIWAHDDRSKINPLLDGIKMFVEVLRIRWYGISGKYHLRGTPTIVTSSV